MIFGIAVFEAHTIYHNTAEVIKYDQQLQPKAFIPRGQKAGTTQQKN